jgi:Domain of unknown function (DUF397)
MNDSDLTTGWVKASRSGARHDCVELAAMAGGGLAIRDSKNPDGPRLRFGPAAAGEFLTAAKNGEFDALAGGQ